jgi:MA3 domain
VPLVHHSFCARLCLPKTPVHTRLHPSPLQISALVEEYFASGDVIAAAESLSDAGCPSSMGHYFVKRLITMALDRRDREREMASALLSSLYGEVLPSEQLAKGFARLVESLDDLRLDVPDAVECLALFIARGVVRAHACASMSVATCRAALSVSVQQRLR